METDSLTETERFFYDHAGFSYRTGVETEEQGHVRCARELAAAESRLKAGPYYVDVTPDLEPWDSDVPYDGPLWIVTLYDVADSTEGRIVDSLCGVATETVSDPYIRVVAAELASESIPAEGK